MATRAQRPSGSARLLLHEMKYTREKERTATEATEATETGLDWIPLYGLVPLRDIRLYISLCAKG